MRAKIPGSKLYRAYCPKCGTPMRVTKEAIVIPVCRECSPHQTGCSSPRSPIDDDAFRISTQHDYAGTTGS